MALLRHRLHAGLIILTLAGCSRSHYRTDADAETYPIVAEKEMGTPWELTDTLDIQPASNSRLFDPSNPDCPDLPNAEPRLYEYVLPIDAPVSPAAPDHPPVAILDPEPLLPSGDQMPGVGSGELTSRIQELPKSAWMTIPESCLVRMFEFESVRNEYKRSFESAPTAEQRDQSPRLTLENIVYLTQLNSREYQSEKEALYRSALALTLERFDYLLKFSPNNNGTALNYDYRRIDGNSSSSLVVPSRTQVDKLLTTGGTLLARFANDVVLTFNGADGFASDISSELLFDFTQSILQRDIQFEPLIQAERNVVYSARDYTRFRRALFFNVARSYYNLLLNYRQIEIEAQNYFSLVRELEQAEEEEATGIQRAPSRIQVEQIEQSTLQGRSGLISRCNALENSLDQLKLTIGIPTESPINIDLDELFRLTLGDESEVTGERVARALKRARGQRTTTRKEVESPDPQVRLQAIRSLKSGVVTASLVLTERLIDWLGMRESLGEQTTGTQSLRSLAARLQIAERQLIVDLLRDELAEAKNNPDSPSLLLFRRTIDLCEGIHGLINTHILAAELKDEDRQEASQARSQLTQVQEQAATLLDKLQTILESGDLEQLETLPPAADQLLTDTERLGQSTTLLAELDPVRSSPEQELDTIYAFVDQLIMQAEEQLGQASEGLIPVMIEQDEAMMTALSNRFDLMNTRGAVADSRRDVKYRADDLRSVLNLNVSQRLGHRKLASDDKTDSSITSLNLELDLPFNRQAQRNSYRSTLIDYQRALRNLLDLEDRIKRDVRAGVRDLVLRRVQYQISVASAALAFERVTSTRLELNLGIGNVAARDFLEAQDAYRSALSGVATNHINYLIDRTEFFLNLELLKVDESGFWPELNDEDFQPTPSYEFPPSSGQPYGDLPQYLKMTPELRGTIVPGRY